MTRFGCPGCDATWQWLREPDGTVLIHGSVRQHVDPDGELVPCENPALRQVDEQRWVQKWLR
jgi:hypothetical protein